MTVGGWVWPAEPSMKRILVIGRAGQLATALTEASWPADIAVAARGRDRIDLAQPAATREAVVAEKPDLVINAAAYTAVDKAESEPELAFTVNRDGPAALAEACQAIGAPLMHVSTDYVFDGSKRGAYVEEDPVNPASVYGASKEAGESAIRARLPAHVIIRSSWIYAPMGQNFVRTMLRLGRERPELRVVDDQIGSPTAAEELARAVQGAAGALLAGGSDYGTFHFAGSGSTSWFGLAQAIFELAEGPRPRLIPIPTSGYPTPARRPANSVLDSSRFARLYGVTARPWRDSLARCLKEIAARGTRTA
jgi:dTDP-4-dehydrorhamnose reductase